MAENFTNDSAMMIAYERALETLFQDPFAEVLAGSKGESLSAAFGANCAMFELTDWPEFHKTWTAVRTRFIDEHVCECTGTKCFAQLVNLGAGMDVRPYRLKEYSAFEGGCFDVDMEVVNASRQKVFEEVLGNPVSHCPVHTLDLDFLDEAKTLGSELEATTKFDAAKPTVFVAEGLIMYLGEKGKVKLIRDVSAAAAPGSVFILNFMDASDSETATDAQRAQALSQEEAKQALTEHGWEQPKFWKFGESGLDFDRFPNDRFKPRAAFSFLIAVKSA